MCRIKLNTVLLESILIIKKYANKELNTIKYNIN